MAAGQHPVTEAVTGVDLVSPTEAAAGRRCRAQESLRQRGHAIECRICAEDPSWTSCQAGPVALSQPPSGIRVDAGVVEETIGVNYDPARPVVVATKTRPRCSALSRPRAFPIRHSTNIPFLLRVPARRRSTAPHIRHSRQRLAELTIPAQLPAATLPRDRRPHRGARPWPTDWRRPAIRRPREPREWGR